MTLRYKTDLHILKMYMHIKNKVSRPRLSKATDRTGQTHRRKQLNALLHRIHGW